MDGQRVFPGRVIFDHLPKTAGMAVSAWLQESLGAGCVTDHLHFGRHQDLIRRYGGAYSVITAHVDFDQPGLDPRYHYVTCLREPVDRMISWFHYLARNLSEHDVGDDHRHALRFIESEGKELPEGFWWNRCVRHYAAIEPEVNGTEGDLLERAVAAMERYDVWGLYEELPMFLADFAGLLDLPPPAEIARVNVTVKRPKVFELPEAMRRRLESLNALDVEFYAIMKSRYPQARRRWQRPPVAVAGWRPLDRPARSWSNVPDFCLISADVHGGPQQRAGGLLRLRLTFSLGMDVADLFVSVAVIDELGLCAFATNSRMADSLRAVTRAGTHVLEFAAVANFPEGSYSVNIAFVDRGLDPNRTLAHFTRVVDFRVSAPQAAAVLGYARVPAWITVSLIDDTPAGVITDAGGTIRPHVEIGDMEAGEMLMLPLSIHNESQADWLSTPTHPIAVAVRWIDDQGDVIAGCAGESPIAVNTISAGVPLETAVAVTAPQRIGGCTLELSVTRPNGPVLESMGFRPVSLPVQVMPSTGRRRFFADDQRLQSSVGTSHRGVRSSDGRPGHLLFGPYVTLPRGDWRAILSGDFDGRRDVVRADVSSEAGGIVHAVHAIRWQAETIVIPFRLDADAKDVEVRVWVGEASQVRIRQLALEPVEPAGGVNLAAAA